MQRLACDNAVTMLEVGSQATKLAQIRLLQRTAKLRKFPITLDTQRW